jgi:hypothetical protein
MIGEGQMSSLAAAGQQGSPGSSMGPRLDGATALVSPGAHLADTYSTQGGLTASLTQGELLNPGPLPPGTADALRRVQVCAMCVAQHCPTLAY